MSRALRHLLLALALLFSQHAAQLHALSHFGHDLAVAKNGEKNAPALGHRAERCVAFHATDHALPGRAPALLASGDAGCAEPAFALPQPFPPRIVFDSRAPPLLS